jgi:UDP-N-acetylglucosamine diphosphorylase / glucose-1-phosphate thymidylyltransferase / UDP-N-acetylgalactosamine diphosphorylase / glucosamine-1-phosphate N-acetyltransferase / galactosamine-1-phosphate N-acetyltransferase
MKAVILAAGEGVRMRPLTEATPKPMIKVLGKPLLERFLEVLPDDIDEVILVVGYKRDQIQNYFGDEFEDKKIAYVVQEEQLGVAHALFLCKDLIAEGERFLYGYCDDLHSKKVLTKLIKHPLAALAMEYDDPRAFGVFEVDGDGNLVDIEEKPEHPKSNLASTGTYVLDSRIFDYDLVKDSKHGEYFITDNISRMAKDCKFKVVEADFWQPIGYPEDIKKAEEILKNA